MRHDAAKLDSMVATIRECGAEGGGRPDTFGFGDVHIWGKRVDVRRAAAVLGYSFERKSEHVTHLLDARGAYAGLLGDDIETGRSGATLFRAVAL